MTNTEGIELTGGASIKNASMSWPFATLSVSKGLLNINLSVMANVCFSRKNIIRIRPFSDGFFRKGLIIEHNVLQYPKSIKFWNISDVPKTIDTLNQWMIRDEHMVDEKKLKSIQALGVGIFKPKVKKVLNLIFFLLAALKVYRFGHVVVYEDFDIAIYWSMLYNLVFIFIFFLSLSVCFYPRFRLLVLYEHIAEKINRGFIFVISVFVLISFVISSLVGL